MAFQPVPFTAQVDILYLWDSQRVENVLHFRHISGVTEDTIHNLVVNLGPYVEEFLLSTMSNQVEFLGLEAQGLDTDPGVTDTYTPTTTQLGQIATPSVSNNDSLALSLRSGLSGRSNRGRVFLIGMPQQNVAQNTVTGAYRTSVINAWQGLIGLGAITAEWEWCIVSRYANGALRPTGITRGITNIIFADAVLDSQRRRLPGRGR